MGTSAAAAISQMAVFAALVAVLGQVAAIPVGPVPITLQTLGVTLAGAVLGPWRGAGAMVLLNLLAAAGLPLLSQGTGGLGVYAGPTAGFALGWIPAAFVVGLIVQYRWPLRWWRTTLGTVLGGIVVLYACGVPWMALNLGLSLHEAAAANLVFIPGDLAKTVFAILITHSLARAYPSPFSYAQRRRR
ncbi:biotin transporter BioY [Nesterenkonia alba]|uniref:biotin transporter BioY n=1 Tax=Nesterenkonia alba TaxID=515814 RepID=UPI0003B4F51F|nr:biotin transporter BioY [Nesterenkonia alba]